MPDDLSKCSIVSGHLFAQEVKCQLVIISHSAANENENGHAQKRVHHYCATPCCFVYKHLNSGKTLSFIVPH